MVNAKVISLLVAGGSLALIAGVAFWESAERTSPGPLHPSHANVRELQGSRSCRACHSDGNATMASACSTCHEVIVRQLDSSHGLHGTIDLDAALACEQCHREHVGGAIALVSEQSFERAGVPELLEYDHVHAGDFRLNGRHRALECEDCHQNANRFALPVGQQRYLGLTQDCASCHDDPHDATLPDCISCHGQEHSFTLAVGFSHDQFELVGGHDTPDCASCHQDQLFAKAPSDCYSCHIDNYVLTTSPAHLAAKIGTDCTRCHSVYEWTDATFEHMPGFPLTESHSEARCIDCHESGFAVEQVALAASPDTAIRSCAACHDSLHTPEFEVNIAALLAVDRTEDTCHACHDPSHDGFASRAPRIADAGEGTFVTPMPGMTGELHAATGFPLDPPHDGLVCADCHDGHGMAPDAANPSSQPDWLMRFPGRREDECQKCHEDPHGTQFAQSATGGRCIECHARQHFTPSLFDADMHARCGFPLNDSHRAVACAACHKADEGTPRFVPTETACAACHEDAHDGRFDRPELPALVNGQTSCARCHTNSSFHDVTWADEEHERWTEYALIGGHAEASCRDCHRRPAPDGADEVFVRPDTACASCHTDPHLGQFKIDDAVDCQRCHQDTSSFSTLVFDHDRDSRFALDEHHRTLDCAACHRPYFTPAGDIVRYIPLGTECTDCHGSFIPTGGATP